MQSKKVAKHSIVRTISETVAANDCVFIVNYTGLNASNVALLRGSLRCNANAKLKVVKNNLLKIAFAGTSFSCVADFLKGQVAIILTSNPIEVSKVMEDFCVNKELVKFVCLASAQQIYSHDYLSRLSKFENTDSVKAKLLYILNSPAVRLVRILNEPAGGFTRVLKQHSGN